MLATNKFKKEERHLGGGKKKNRSRGRGVEEKKEDELIEKGKG